MFVCKNPDCGWSGNADHNAARKVLHLYRMGLALIPAAGRQSSGTRSASSPLPQGKQEPPGFSRRALQRVAVAQDRTAGAA